MCVTCCQDIVRYNGYTYYFVDTINTKTYYSSKTVTY